MVRDAGFEPAKRRWLSSTYGCSPTTGPTRFKWPEEVEEIALAWAGLPDALKAAVLGIVRSMGTDGGGVLKRGLRAVGQEGK